MVGVASSAATITNGGFEAPTANPEFTSGGVPDGWQVTGTVDLIGTLWQPQEGNQSIDLSAGAPATISQNVSGFVVNAAYELSFWLSGNPGGDPTVKMLTASAGATTGNFTFDTTSTSFTDMGWLEQALRFRATSETMLISFTGTDNPGTPFGAALDNVSLAAVPVPAAGLLLLTALGGAVALGRRKKVATA